jgi:hypothetical protein
MHVSIFNFVLYKPSISLYDQPSTTADTIPYIKTEDVNCAAWFGPSADLRGGDICAWSNGGMVIGRGNPNNVIQSLFTYHKSYMMLPWFKLRPRCKNSEPHTLSYSAVFKNGQRKLVL